MIESSARMLNAARRMAHLPREGAIDLSYTYTSRRMALLPREGSRDHQGPRLARRKAMAWLEIRQGGDGLKRISDDDGGDRALSPTSTAPPGAGAAFTKQPANAAPTAKAFTTGTLAISETTPMVKHHHDKDAMSSTPALAQNGNGGGGGHSHTLSHGLIIFGSVLAFVSILVVIVTCLYIRRYKRSPLTNRNRLSTNSTSPILEKEDPPPEYTPKPYLLRTETSPAPWAANQLPKPAIAARPNGISKYRPFIIPSWPGTPVFRKVVKPNTKSNRTSAVWGDGTSTQSPWRGSRVGVAASGSGGGVQGAGAPVLPELPKQAALTQRERVLPRASRQDTDTPEAQGVGLAISDPSAQTSTQLVPASRFSWTNSSATLPTPSLAASRASDAHSLTRGRESGSQVRDSVESVPRFRSVKSWVSRQARGVDLEAQGEREREREEVPPVPVSVPGEGTRARP